MDPKNACEAKHSKTQQNTAKHSDTQQNTAKHSETQQTTAKQSKTQRSTEERKDWGCLNCKRNSIDCAFIKTLYFSYNIIFSKVFFERYLFFKVSFKSRDYAQVIYVFFVWESFPCSKTSIYQISRKNIKIRARIF